MIIPEILPDELGAGYLIRFKSINGYSNINVAIRNLRKEFLCADEDENLSISILLSRALGITTEQYCRFHTLLPTLRGVTSYLPNIKHGDANHHQLIKNNSHYLFNNEFKVCSKCVHEDIGYHGYAYYRREHQLPGFDFCSKHNQRLVRSDCKHQVNPDKTILLQEVEAEGEYITEIGNDAILRYRIILDSLAGAETPIPLLNILNMLQGKARALNIRWSVYGKKRLLSDLIFEKFPIDWLESLQIKVTKKHAGVYFPTIDSLLKTANKKSIGYLYALALSVLFDHADDALNSSYDCIELAPRVLGGWKRLNEDVWSGKNLHKLYVESGGYAITLAKKLGINKKSVLNGLNRNGMVALGGLNKKILLAYSDFQSGMGLMESCLKHGIELKRLEQILRNPTSVQAEAIKSILAMDSVA